MLILITSVTFTYYLLNNPSFLPVNDLGEYNWINISTLMFLTTLIIFSFLNLLIYSTLSLLKGGDGNGEKREGREIKEEEDKKGKRNKFSRREKIILSFKFSLLITIGLFTVFTLNFFHILNWVWGVSILLVVLIFTFII